MSEATLAASPARKPRSNAIDTFVEVEITISARMRPGAKYRVKVPSSFRNVTERIINAPKHPFFAPPTALLPGRPLTELMRELICGSDFGALPFFDQPRVVGWLDKLDKMEEAERIGYDPVVYYLASLAVLQRHYVAAAA